MRAAISLFLWFQVYQGRVNRRKNTLVRNWEVNTLVLNWEEHAGSVQVINRRAKNTLVLTKICAYSPIPWSAATYNSIEIMWLKAFSKKESDSFLTSTSLEPRGANSSEFMHTTEHTTARTMREEQILARHGQSTRNKQRDVRTRSKFFRILAHNGAHNGSNHARGANSSKTQMKHEE